MLIEDNLKIKTNKKWLQILVKNNAIYKYLLIDITASQLLSQYIRPMILKYSIIVLYTTLFRNNNRMEENITKKFLRATWTDQNILVVDDELVNHILIFQVRSTDVQVRN